MTYNNIWYIMIYVLYLRRTGNSSAYRGLAHQALRRDPGAKSQDLSKTGGEQEGGREKLDQRR